MNDHYTRWGKDWEERNKEERKAYRARWYQANKLRISEQQREYRANSDQAIHKILKEIEEDQG